MIQIRNIKQPTYSTSQREIKSGNTMMLFNMIRDNMPISRVNLSRNCPLAVSTVSSLVENLLEKNWIVEKDTVSTSGKGRHAIMLEVNAQMGYVVTVELLSRRYICTVYDICLHKISGIDIKNTIYDSNHIITSILTLMKSSKLDIEKLLGIHLIFPGIIDKVSGDLISSTVFPDIEILNRHLAIQLKSHFPKVDVQISNNGTIIAFKEFALGKGLSALPLLSVNIDEAIFGGIVTSNENSNMTFCFPVEIGHSIINYRGERCLCGNRGCMETLCTTPVLFRKLNESAHMNLTYSELFGSEINVDTMHLVAKELESGNREVEKVIQSYTETLCSALLSTINLLGIQSVHIGGDLAILGKPFLEMLKTTFAASFSPLIGTGNIHFDLFNSDYEDVRQAATMMSLDNIFRE
ncbi:MAG: ROK family protein [Lachnospiraceae bacterium]|nr:ROK family protein [Lachnospiraceae bacterium]